MPKSTDSHPGNWAQFLLTSPLRRIIRMAVAVRRIVVTALVASTNLRSNSTSSPVSTEMGDRSWVYRLVL